MKKIIAIIISVLIGVGIIAIISTNVRKEGSSSKSSLEISETQSSEENHSTVSAIEISSESGLE